MGRWTGIERAARVEFGPYVAGIDEVGRGPLAGPVVVCAIIMPPDQRAIRGVDDSKRLSAGERERLAVTIRERALAMALGAASVREVERLNIYHATVLAMHRAVTGLTRRFGRTPDHFLIDGKPLRTLGIPHTAVVKGDAKVYTIACASIVAKVTRDHLMVSLANRYPGYGWDRNAGYGTPAHLAAIQANGLTPHHRRTFCQDEQVSFAALLT
jgi:ribonuclease HII